MMPSALLTRWESVFPIPSLDAMRIMEPAAASVTFESIKGQSP